MTLSYHRLIRTLMLPVLLSALAAGPAGAFGGVGDLYVTSDASNLVRAYNGTNGTFLGNQSFGVLGSGSLGISFGATNARYLVGSFGGGVDEYSSITGAYIKTYNPGGSWMWSAIYAPNGNVYVASMSSNSIEIYDPNTAAFIGTLCGVTGPADMRIGPNGNLYICSFFGGYVLEVNAGNGNFVSLWNTPFGEQPNDIAFLPNGEILVTAMGTNVCYRYDPAYNLIGSFAGTGWGRPHGIDISPADGNIYIADGVSTQVHVFDPVTFAELDAAYLTPGPGDKIVDLEFRRDTLITPVEPTTWTRLKTMFK